ncbi:MAG TPA: DUF4912 domain-containing protein [Fibrobacteraceae bacterium]|jgi:hypothetical protein|nr:DUF4912 domain-containing protein [Fibrobacter sp.]HOG68768.1 DUF4912 domain-containing protein [Fibrobacteraceae bacterium]HPW94537.1 DUF4912 domain-containing protein [Fibrobacteraceae bacterium]
MAITKKTTAKESVKKVASKIVEKIMPKTKKKETAVKAESKKKEAVVKAETKKKETSVKVESKKPAPVSTKAKGTKVKKEEPKKAGLKKTEVKKAETKKVAVKKEAAKKETVKKVESKKTSTSKKEEAAHSFAPEYLVMMQKDPNWLQAFWEVADSRLKKVKAGKEKLVLRLFDISSDLTVRRSKKRVFKDIEIPADAKSWYVQNHNKEGGFRAAIGTASGSEFTPIIETGDMQTFSFEGIRPNTENMFFKASLGTAKIGGFNSSGLSSVSAESWLEQLASSSESMFSGTLSSGALASNVSKDSVNYGKDFFLWVKTRLIVYGGTRPDAHLQVRGEPFPLNADGTFSLEMDLPDSTQVIPVFATDKDGDFPTTIVPIVVKRTE